MALTKKETAGAMKVLKMLAHDELMSLAKTVTKGQLSFSSLEEAVRAILVYTESPAELLRRKKIRREVLFQYAHDENLRVMPTDEKPILVRHVLTYWGSQNVSDDYMAQLDDDDTTPSITGPSQERQQTASTRQISASPSIPPPQNVARMPPMPDLVSTHDFNCWNDRSLRITEEGQQMAEQFLQWFFQRLNSSALVAGDFFRDAVLHLCVVRVGSSPTIERFDGSDLAVSRLVAFVANERLIFNPNSTPDGVRGTSDQHGRRVIFICGTVHRDDTVVGLFEQQFGLVRDPTAENNWKVHATRLALSTSATALKPTLEVTQRMLASS